MINKSLSTHMCQLLKLPCTKRYAQRRRRRLITIPYLIAFSQYQLWNVNIAYFTIQSDWKPFQLLERFHYFHSPASANRIYLFLNIVFCKLVCRKMLIVLIYPAVPFFAID